MPSPHPDLVIDPRQTSPTTFRAEDRNDKRFYIYGTVTSGVLWFEVLRRVGTDKSTITGREFFDAMMAHFGAKVRVIEARWNDSAPILTS